MISAQPQVPGNEDHCVKKPSEKAAIIPIAADEPFRKAGVRLPLAVAMQRGPDHPSNRIRLRLTAIPVATLSRQRSRYSGHTVTASPFTGTITFVEDPAISAWNADASASIIGKVP